MASNLTRVCISRCAYALFVIQTAGHDANYVATLTANGSHTTLSIDEFRSAFCLERMGNAPRAAAMAVVVGQCYNEAGVCAQYTCAAPSYTADDAKATALDIFVDPVFGDDIRPANPMPGGAGRVHALRTLKGAQRLVRAMLADDHNSNSDIR